MGSSFESSLAVLPMKSTPVTSEAHCNTSAVSTNINSISSEVLYTKKIREPDGTEDIVTLHYVSENLERLPNDTITTNEFMPKILASSANTVVTTTGNT